MTTGEHADRRFAQLTYTSCERGDRPGGWGVQEVTGALAAAERAALTRRIVPRFVPATPVPAYPDPAQLAFLPARVVHAPVPEIETGPGGPTPRDTAGPTAYWHTVPCGTDAHGRPGNVFVHVLLDRGSPEESTPEEKTRTTTDDAPVARPSDLASTGCWLRPYGPAAVASTALRDAPAPPWLPDPGRAAVVDFLFDERGGPGIATLCLLLDALDAAMRGGRTVVLGVGAMERAPLWIATVNHLMSVGAARSCGWSSYERVPHAEDWPADLHLVVVPARDLDDAPAPAGPGAVLGEDEEVPRAELGGPPRTTRHGSPVAVTPWSVMAFVVLAERAGAEALLARMDVVGAAVPEARHPAWAMAMAIAQAPDLARDAVPAAREVLEHFSPPLLAVRHPELYASVLDLVAETVGHGVADLRTALLTTAPGARRAVLRDLYLLRVLEALAEDHDDVGWAGSGESGVALGDPDPARPVATAVRERAATFARALSDDLSDPGSPRGLAAVHRGVTAVELLATAGAEVLTDPAVTGFWDRVVVALLDRAAGAAVAGRIGGRVGPASRRGLDDAVRRRLHGDPAEPGTRLPATVLGLLGVRLPRPADLVEHGGPDELQRELAALLTLADPDPSAAAWLVRAWDLLGDRDIPGARGDRPTAELTRLVRAAEGETAPGGSMGTVGTDGGRPAHPRDLALLLTHRDHPALHRATLRTLLTAADDEHLDALVAVVLAGRERPRRLVDAARLRRLVASGAPADPARRDELLGLAGSLLPAVPARDVARAVWRALLVAQLADAAVRAGPASDPGRSGRGGPAGPGGWGAADRLPEAIRCGAVGVARDSVVAVTLAAAPELESAALVHAALALRLDDESPETAPLRALAGPDCGPITELLLAAARQRWRTGTLVEADRDAALRRVRRDRRGNGLVRRRHHEVGGDPEALAQQWWGDVVTAHATPGPGPARS